MGRIDEALRRAGTEDRAGAPLPQPAGSANDVFSSPWAFPAEGGATADTGRESSVPAAPSLEVALPQEGRMGVFQGFPSELAGRIVSSPGASPMLSEQFRRLAATLHHAQLVQGTKVVMITSANPGDGKTLTATNLALTLSESYRRQVLLVDADLRRPSLHEVFRVPNVAGLNDGLKARQSAKLAVLRITDTLTLLPAGRPDPDPMSSLTSTRMGDILREGRDALRLGHRRHCADRPARRRQPAVDDGRRRAAGRAREPDAVCRGVEGAREPRARSRPRRGAERHRGRGAAERILRSLRSGARRDGAHEERLDIAMQAILGGLTWRRSSLVVMDHALIVTAVLLAVILRAGPSHRSGGLGPGVAGQPDRRACCNCACTTCDLYDVRTLRNRRDLIVGLLQGARRGIADPRDALLLGCRS